MPKLLGGKPRKRADGSYEVRLRYSDGARPWRLVPGGNSIDEKTATTRAAEMAKRAIKMPHERATVRRVDGELVDDWFRRWCADRTKRGLLCAPTDRGNYANHIARFIGRRPMPAVTPDDIEKIRDALDDKIIAGELAWKTAANIWTLVTKMFGDAVRIKRRDLRILTANPTLGIEGPDRGTRKAKQYLFPTEFRKLVASPVPPLHWRRVFAITTYLYLRGGELEALSWDDVDLEHASVHITKAIQTDGTLGPPKNGTARRVPIERTLMPLLRRMHRDAGGRGQVIHAPQKSDRAGQLRVYLTKAGVTRHDLFRRSATTTPITFHDLRATGITWCAVRGDDPYKLKQRAGHRTFSTTEIYIRTAEELREGFGKVFPPLPRELIGQSIGHLHAPKAKG